MDKVADPHAPRRGSWLEQVRILSTEVANVRVRQSVYREIHTAIQMARTSRVELAQGSGAGVFLGVFDGLYVEAQLLALRRMVDRRRDSVSLRSLLDDIARHPEALSRQRHRAMVDRGGLADDRGSLGDADFDRLAGTASQFVDPLIVRGDIDELDRVLEHVKRRADKFVAHREVDAHAPLKYRDIDDAIDAVAAMLERYLVVIDPGSGLLVPRFEGDWKIIFRSGLFPAAD